jgi:aquaporin Z
MAVLLQLGQAIGNTPFNPARATASALFSNADSLGQLWLFWVAPLVGAVLAGLVFRGFTPVQATEVAAPEDEEEFDAEDIDDAPGETELAPAGGVPVRTARPASADGASADVAGAEQARTPGRDDARDFFDGSRGR